MRRTSVFLTEEQYHDVEVYVQRTGLKFAEVLRRIVDEWRDRLPRPPPSPHEKEG